MTGEASILLVSHFNIHSIFTLTKLLLKSSEQTWPEACIVMANLNCVDKLSPCIGHCSLFFSFYSSASPFFLNNRYRVLRNRRRSAPERELIPKSQERFDSGGIERRLSDYRGKIVVIDFWATWCGPCIRAMPSLQKVHDQFTSRGVEVFGVNVWEESNAVEFMKRNGYTYGLLLKGERAADAYRVPSLPTLYVIGPDGRIIHRVKGLDENLSQFIENRVKEIGM